MKLDRNTQLKLLEFLSLRYPCVAHSIDLPEELSGAEKVFANASYLHEHKLIELEIGRAQGFGAAEFGSAKITARGIDFLASDGGLTAILEGQPFPRAVASKDE